MKPVKLSEVIQMLENGKSRTEINAELELNPREAKFLWSNEKLKGIKKNKFKIEIDLVDDTTPVQEVTN